MQHNKLIAFYILINSLNIQMLNSGMSISLSYLDGTIFEWWELWNNFSTTQMIVKESEWLL